MYYVYAYLRKDGTPYYIGKGTGRRWRYHDKRERYQTPKDKSRIIFLERNLTELGAFALERRMIRWYGRLDIGTGCLRNLTDGGEGQCGRPPINKGVPMSVEQKKKVSESCLGRPAWNRGKENPTASSNGRRGAAKLSQTATGRKKHVLPNGTWTWVYPESR